MCDRRHTFTHSANTLVKLSIDPKPLSMNKLISDYAHAVNDVLEQLAPAFTSYGNISPMTSSISVLIFFNTLVVSSSLPLQSAAPALFVSTQVTSHSVLCSFGPNILNQLQERRWLRHEGGVSGAAVAQA